MTAAANDVRRSASRLAVGVNAATLAMLKPARPAGSLNQSTDSFTPNLGSRFSTDIPSVSCFGYRSDSET